METQAPAEKAQYFPIPLGIMQPGTVAPVNLYILTGGDAEYTLYKTAQTPLSGETRQRLVEREVASLYVRQEDKGAYFDYVEDHIDAIIRDDLLPPQKACEIVYESSTRVMSDALADPRSGRNMQRARNMVEATVLSILKNPHAIWQMTSIASHDYYTYTHCVNVAMFLIGASKDIFGVEDHARLVRIGLGGMLHDIGKSQVPGAILNKPGRLTPEEFEKVKAHPRLGLELVSRQGKIAPTTAAIILGHHERFHGQGYPGGLSGTAIQQEVRLATVIDVYDALTTVRPYAPARRPFEALTMMLGEMGGHFEPALLNAFVKFLGPKAALAAREGARPAAAS